MVQLKFIIILIGLLLLPLESNFIQNSQATLQENNEGSDDAQENFSKSIGVYTGILLIIGLIYVGMMRSYILIRKYVDKEKYPKVIEISKLTYSYLRKPLFYLHVSINIIAIFFGIYHGLLVEVKSELQANLGWLSVLIMIISSVSGFIMWLKLRPIWDNREFRLAIRSSHRQWILSLVLLISIIIHVSFGEVH